MILLLTGFIFEFLVTFPFALAYYIDTCVAGKGRSVMPNVPGQDRRKNSF